MDYLIILGNIFYFSGIEWNLHRFVMHRPLGRFTYPYKRHAGTHHRIFRSDESYHLIREKDKWTIPMAWWNGLVLVAISMIPILILGWILHNWKLIWISAVVGAAYYCTYEWIHWCMHLPRLTKRWLTERWIVGWVFRRLNGHHLLHHRHMNKNFNVVCPVWDLMLGTLLVRAPHAFDQPRGHSVPDVQPKVRLTSPPDKGRKIVWFEV